jgi:hypothetical protein
VTKLTDGHKKMKSDLRDAVSQVTNAKKKVHSGNKANKVITKLAALEK